MTVGPGRTAAAAPGSAVEWDAVVVGGGAAGLSAAVFLARYGLETLVLARGKSAIGQCAVLENFLGFPGGITPQRFLALGRAQVTHEGGVVREEAVETVERVDIEEPRTEDGGEAPGVGGFRVESDEGEYRTRYVLAATAYDGDMFAPFVDEIETGDEFGMAETDHGRTAIEGLYGAGWMTTETVHQALVNAGHGARAAVSLIRDDVAARYWPGVADQYVDWVVHEGRYGGDDWDEHTREWFEEDVLVDGVDPDLAETALAELKAGYLAREVDADERRRRDREGQRRMLEQFDDEVVRAYAEDLQDEK
ncbi:FAD-binding protein [Natronomonas marina]|jgi:NADPH-dependent 2,4-dienoyl-CoA reductase/sulfur reductase-like enzyme|uniref:FAD-binding protein n=1 Tax=Natronomonas marina TaxID=2961939 RepID=UPI0020C93D91|nr:FAD-binding protein [Natronomonas marina]